MNAFAEGYVSPQPRESVTKRPLMTDEQIVDKIQSIRADNNKVWMNLVRLALRVAPKEAKAFFNEITDNDQKVSALLRQLANQ